MDVVAEAPREKLRQIIEKNGEAIPQDSDRVEGLLRHHGDHTARRFRRWSARSTSGCRWSCGPPGRQR
jgi:hypothetical protein